jgi:hypothetical protein
MKPATYAACNDGVQMFGMRNAGGRGGTAQNGARGLIALARVSEDRPKTFIDLVITRVA